MCVCVCYAIHSPVFDLVSPLHVIDVHANFVVDIGRQVCAVVTSNVREHNPSPELLVIQETHGLVDQAFLVSNRLQLVQVHTLKADEGYVSCFFCI